MGFADGSYLRRCRRVLYLDLLCHCSHNEAQFLEHLILRAEVIYNFQLPVLPVLPPPRPWWKLWAREPEVETPAIVSDLRNVA